MHGLLQNPIDFLGTPCTKCTEIASGHSASAKEIVSIIICELSQATQVKTRQRTKRKIMCTRYSWE